MLYADRSLTKNTLTVRAVSAEVVVSCRPGASLLLALEITLPVLLPREDITERHLITSNFFFQGPSPSLWWVARWPLKVLLFVVRHSKKHSAKPRNEMPRQAEQSRLNLLISQRGNPPPCPEASESQSQGRREEAEALVAMIGGPITGPITVGETDKRLQWKVREAEDDQPDCAGA